MEKVKEIKSLNIITEQYNNLVVLLVFQKKIIYKNVFIRVGYDNIQDEFGFYSATRYQQQEYFFAIPSVIGGDCYIAPIALREYSKFIYIELIDAENQTINFIFQRATSVCNPYTALQKYTEVQVEIGEDNNLTHSQLVRDILDSSNTIDSSMDNNFQILNTQTREELCEDANICDKYNTVWITDKNNPISIIWANEDHWNIVHDHMGNVNKRTAWPLYDCPEIVQGMNQIGRYMILKLLGCSTIKKKNTPIQGFIEFGKLNAVALCKLLIREALNNHSMSKNVNVGYELLDVDNHFLHVLYQNVLSLHSVPYNIIHYPKLCHKLGINDNYIKHILFLLQQKQTYLDSSYQSNTFYVRQGNIWLYANKYPLQNTQKKLLNTLSISLSDKLINELLYKILYNTDVVIKFDGVSIVISSDILPPGVTIESNLDQVVELENINTILDVKNKINKYIY